MSTTEKNENIRSGNDDQKSADRTVSADIHDNTALYSIVCLIDIPYHLDRLFNYKVPDEFKDIIRRGDFVRVPFGAGNRQHLALVISCTTDKPELDIKKLKEITEILPSEISLSEEQTSLCEYMHEHIICSYGDAIHAIVPSFIIGKTKTVYSVTPYGHKKLDEMSSRTSRSNTDKIRMEILSAISAKQGKITRSALQSIFSQEQLRLLSELERTGAVKTEFSINRIGKKFEETAILKVASEEAEELADLYARKAPLMSAVLRELAAYDEIQLEELKNRTGAGKNVIRRLEDRGYLNIEKCEIYRTPFTDIGNIKPDVRPLTPAQKAAYERLDNIYSDGKAQAVLLYGVTGSGKTRVIKEMIDRVISDGKQVIVLVPEISLTPQTVGYFCSCYGTRVAIVHSLLSQGERYDAWRSMKHGDVDICIGTRSAVFAPFDNIGMIVIDEEQEHTYKSDTSPKYHARDIARFRCARNNGILLLASATPSIETYYRAKTGRYLSVRLTERIGGTSLPETIISNVAGLQKNGGGLIGSELDLELKEVLSKGRQAILFMNRRGYNHFVSCPSCGEALRCPNCSISLTYHTVRHGDGELRCHMCGYKGHVPENCPSCGKSHLVHFGAGIQKVEEELKIRYPNARIMRMDADTTSSKASFYKMIDRFRSGEADILIGTQMVTKGHDFPGVDVAGVILADTSLYLDDYRANERTFSMLTQLIGRSGRSGKQGHAVIQTFSPEHPIIKLASDQNYDSFYKSEIEFRRAMLFPPFCRIALISITAEDDRTVAAISSKFYTDLCSLLKGDFRDVRMVIFGPYEAQIYRVNKRYRYRIICKLRSDARTRLLLRTILQKYAENGSADYTIGIDIDPSNL